MGVFFEFEDKFSDRLLTGAVSYVIIPHYLGHGVLKRLCEKVPIGSFR